MRQHDVHQEIANGGTVRETDDLVADVARRFRIKELRIGHFLDARVDKGHAEKETQRQKRPFQRSRPCPPVRFSRSRGRARTGHGRLRLSWWNWRTHRFAPWIATLFHDSILYIAL